MNSFGGNLTRDVGTNGFGFYLEHKATGDPITTGTPVLNYVLDNGAQGQISAAAAHKGNGQWTVDLSASEKAGDMLNLQVTHPDAKTFHFTLSLRGADVNAIAGSQSAAANLAAGAEALEPFTVGAAPSATSIPTGITGAPFTTTNHYEGRVVTINKETRKIFGSGGSPVVLTTEAFNSVPSQNDPGVIS